MSRGYLIALFAICAAYFWMCVEHISASLPYPQHIDEQLVAEKAVRILTSGDFHPRSFHYPSLPIYLTAAGMAVGFVITASDLEVEKIRIDRDLGDVSFPFYSIHFRALSGRHGSSSRCCQPWPWRRAVS